MKPSTPTNCGQALRPRPSPSPPALFPTPVLPHPSQPPLFCHPLQTWLSRPSSSSMKKNRAAQSGATGISVTARG